MADRLTYEVEVRFALLSPRNMSRNPIVNLPCAVTATESETQTKHQSWAGCRSMTLVGRSKSRSRGVWVHMAWPGAWSFVSFSHESSGSGTSPHLSYPSRTSTISTAITLTIRKCRIAMSLNLPAMMCDSTWYPAATWFPLLANFMRREVAGVRDVKDLRFLQTGVSEEL